VAKCGYKTGNNIVTDGSGRYSDGKPKVKPSSREVETRKTNFKKEASISQLSDSSGEEQVSRKEVTESKTRKPTKETKLRKLVEISNISDSSSEEQVNRKEITKPKGMRSTKKHHKKFDTSKSGDTNSSEDRPSRNVKKGHKQYSSSEEEERTWRVSAKGANKYKKLEPETKLEFNHGVLGFLEQWQKSELRRTTINLAITINPLTKRGEDVKEWFKNFEFITTANGWDDTLRGQRASLHFRKEALYQWKLMDEKRRYDYKSIKKTLREELDGEEFQSKAAAELFSAKQLDTENAEEFGRRLNKLRKRSQMKVDGSLLLDRYLRGIKNSIRNAVKASRPGSLREAMETAREMEQLDDLSDAVSERINREGDRTEIGSGTDSDIMSISQLEGSDAYQLQPPEVS